MLASPPRPALVVAALVAVAACGPAAPPPDPSAAPPPTAEPRPPGAADTSRSAVDVVRDYYAAIDAGDVRRAYGLWGDDGRASGQSYDAFAAGFAQTERVTADVGEPSDEEGAAGSLYVTVPVTVHARTEGGAAQTFVGAYRLRRVNDVPGATAAQLRWHLASARLEAAP